MNYQLEIIGFSIESCMLAQQAGANRIELCDNPGDGGTTPSYGFIKAAREKLQIALYPIIRPRGGDFLYSEEEFAIMKDDIRTCKSLHCDGVVLGLLKADGTVDRERCKELVALAYPMGVTFHRAFDRAADCSAALEDIIECGIERILSSGGRPTVSESMDILAALIKQADHRISIMPGSGLRADNIITVAEKTGATEFHSSARIFTDSKISYQNPAMNEQLKNISADVDEIKKMRQLLNEYAANK